MYNKSHQIPETHTHLTNQPTNHNLPSKHNTSHQTTQYIDASEKGGLARFVNHACEPNCLAQKWRVGSEWRIGFFAQQDMAKDTELSIDYGWEAVYGRKKTKCLCGCPGCRGFIEKDDTVALAAEETWSQIRGVVGTWRANRR